LERRAAGPHHHAELGPRHHARGAGGDTARAPAPARRAHPHVPGDQWLRRGHGRQAQEPPAHLRRRHRARPRPALPRRLPPAAGYGCQVSLCWLGFGGVGGVVLRRVAGGGSPVGLIAAAGAGGLLGALIALPALRLQALYLALSTLAFAVLMDNIFFLSVLGGQGGNQKVGRLHLWFVSFRGDRADMVLLAVAFAFLANLVLA